MLEPSFALTRRLQQDQHRVEAENELKLQSQPEQFWQRIGRLEHHVRRSEGDKAMTRLHLQSLAQEKRILQGRVQKLEDDKTDLENRVKELEKDDSATERGTQGPETALPSVRTTPTLAVGALHTQAA